jgi:tRNA A37 threonylcarbamoyladenosine biosynthesis protein TsaE
VSVLNVKRCEIVTQLENGDGTLFDMEKMKLVLASKKCIEKFSYIIHDKDIYTEADEERTPEHKAGTLKPSHIHLLIRFHSNQPQDTKFICKWFGLTENFVNKINGKWEDALLYQVHRNAPDKFQYTSDEVVCNFDYEAVVSKYLDKKQNPLMDAIKGILDGTIREYNKTLEIDQMILVNYAQKINEAFKVRQSYLEATAKERNTQVIFITGKSGSGKTTLAKRIAKEKGLAYFISSGSNDVMDGYSQQPVLILDDLRPSCMGLSDLLKMLDNWNASSVKSRYKNKYLNCEILIITTVLDIDTFYQNVFSEEKEPITQLKRRCKIYIRMDRETINISMWDDKTMRYTNEIEYKNNLLDEYIPSEKKSKKDVKEQIALLMPFLELDEPVFNLVPVDKKGIGKNE